MSTKRKDCSVFPCFAQWNSLRFTPVFCRSSPVFSRHSQLTCFSISVVLLLWIDWFFPLSSWIFHHDAYAYCERHMSSRVFSLFRPTETYGSLANSRRTRTSWLHSAPLRSVAGDNDIVELPYHYQITCWEYRRRRCGTHYLKLILLGSLFLSPPKIQGRGLRSRWACGVTRDQQTIWRESKLPLFD